MTLETLKLIPWLSALAALFGGICCLIKPLRKFAAAATIAALLASFALTLCTHLHAGAEAEAAATAHSITAFQWIHIGALHVDFAYFVDPLTIIMLFVVTGVGSLVAWYAAGYMSGDRGYARFFAFVSLFIFAMTTLVMADNLVLLYLGWEGVGLCSYLLIGFYYDKPSAVAAAKKAFIVNRIGDLGFAIGIFLTFTFFHTLQIHDVVNQASAKIGSDLPTMALAIPFFLMLGAFGKSAQLPLYVWLPDAMEGPTPVSALIHAATMVTAGIYMIARLLPVFEMSPYALPVVATVGAVTALFAATIALAQYDIKRIWAYSTISQLGYMFLGVGALSTVGGIFHLFTHAFFKALLFLAAGSVMHALSGQIDLREISGLGAKMPVTKWLTLIGCLALAGFPFTSGFFSKDTILADAMVRGLSGEPGTRFYAFLSALGLITAFLTAYYTFRVWFRVFLGPTEYEMGSASHAAAHDTPGHAAHGAADPATPVTVEHHHEAHEVSWFMNAPLVILAIGALVAGALAEHSGWIEEMISHSTAQPHLAEPTGETRAAIALLHIQMQLISGTIAILGILLAAYYHWLNRAAADAVARRYAGILSLLNHKYYIDELNDALIVRPLNTLGFVFFTFDRLIIDGLVSVFGWVPRALGLTIQPSQRGALQGYGLGMAVGAGIVLFAVILAVVH